MFSPYRRVLSLPGALAFSMSGLVWVTDAGSLDHIVTDAPLPDACQAAIETSGLEVSIA